MVTQSVQDIELVERVQRRFTKRLPGLKPYAYARRLEHLKLPSLELRRLHADLVWCYLIYFNHVDINFDDFFTFSAVTNTRGHKYKLYKLHSRCNTRRFFFTERVVNVWNSLPPSVNFSSLSTFKRTICEVDFSEFLAF